MLNVFSAETTDRGLAHTSQSITVATAASGVFFVVRRLADIAQRRIRDLGTGCDLVCVVPPPLHRTPLFVVPGEGVNGAAGVHMPQVHASHERTRA